MRNGGGCLRAYPVHLHQLLFRSIQDSHGIGEVFEQLANPDRADIVDHIQGHQGLAGIHADLDNAETSGASSQTGWFTGLHQHRLTPRLQPALLSGKFTSVRPAGGYFRRRKGTLMQY